MKKIAVLTLINLLLSASHICAQSAQSKSILLKPTTEKIVLDGILDEAAWFAGVHADNFWQYFPTDSVQAQSQTEIYMTYDDAFLYVGVKCYSISDEYITPSLRRDYSFFGNDNVSILFDTYNDRTNAFFFGMNPFGVRREALISDGGRTPGSFSGSWDNKWLGESKIHKGYWVAEFAIPFKTLRFNPGSDRWRFNSYRYDTQRNEISTWMRIPQNQIIQDIAFMGEMHWEQPLEKTGKNISIIPYAIGGAFRDYTDPEQQGPVATRNIGGDAKVAITSALNLDLTVNPDFSQVEVDQQVTNLDRFEIRFPEKRQFFLENADLFGSFGNRRVNPFFSRRIGIAVDTATGQNIQNPIRFGARLSGKLNENLRIGLLNMQTAPEAENGLPGFNYTVAALQQKVFSRSNLSFILVNKQGVNQDNYQGSYNPYNRLAGLEYRLATPDNTWSGKYFHHQAITPSDEKHKFSTGLSLEYLKRRFRLEWAHIYVGHGFDAEVGFVPRRDYLLLSPEFQLYFYPQNDFINTHDFTVDTRLFFKPGNDGNNLLPAWGNSDRQLTADWEINFRDNSRGQLGYQYDYIFLLRDFDPTRIQADSVFLQAGSTHTFHSAYVSYRSDRRKVFSYDFQPTLGQFYNGIRTGLQGSFTWRYQPYGFVSLDYTYNYIKLAAPFEPVNLWLVGPRIDLTFSKKLFLTTFIQYNNQLDNLNINARLQWRFQPVSDFFLVFTDNYLTDPFSQFSVRNRAIVAKLTYWLNL